MLQATAWQIQRRMAALYTANHEPKVINLREHCTHETQSLKDSDSDINLGAVSLLGIILLMDKILHDPKDPKLWELWYIPYNG